MIDPSVLRLVNQNLLCSPLILAHHKAAFLSPFLFIMYTNDCQSIDSSSLLFKFSDDAAILALLNDADSVKVYRSSVTHFSEWCTTNFLELNVSKTKEITIDFRRNAVPAVIAPL